MNMPSSVGPSSDHDVANQAAQSADAAIRSARQKAHDALDGLSDRMRDVKDQASATLESLRPQLDSVATYAREEPTKALLIAAAAGAGIMGLIALMSRSGGGRRMPSKRSLRRAAYAMAERARDSARDVGDNVRRSMRDAGESVRHSARGMRDDMRQSASDTADQAAAKVDEAVRSGRSSGKAAYETLTDTMQHLKEQAAPWVDKVRPQVDHVMGYAKDDPAKALMIAAVAGAALMGLINAFNSER
jgi:ElaB/YqjD/DUF883 family membrane-anchored ribosome-binding protein